MHSDIVELKIRGKDELIDLSTLSVDNQMALTKILCNSLIGDLDDVNIDSHIKNNHITNLGSSLKTAKLEVFLAAAKHIGIDRLIKFKIDLHPSWTDSFEKLEKNKKDY